MKILVVDASPIDRAHLRRLLRQFPQRYAADEATSGHGALEHLARERYHCVLLADALADMTAAQLLHALGDRTGDTPPVILLSGGNDETALRQCLESGAHDYLLKAEVSVPALARALRRATERQRSDAKSPDLATQDALTSLHNAAFFRQYLRKAIERAGRQDRNIGVLLIDVQALKSINDTHGYDAGDAVLKQVAMRLTAAVRSSDLVARLGGEEFAVLAEDIAHAEHLPTLADKIHKALAQSFAVGACSVSVATHIRTAVFPALVPARAAAEADPLTGGDFATYHPRAHSASGTPGAAEWADRESQQRLRRRLTETVRLQPFHLHYQPRFRASTQRLEALEGLLRWDDPELGPVPPAAFIPICERNGMISLLGRVAVERACADWLQHLGRVVAERPLKLSLNLSPGQLLDDDFLASLKTEVQASSLRGRLQVEISDKAGVQNSKRCLTSLERLASAGVAVSIDDFGAGSTSVAQLTAMPVSNVILDATLTDGIAPGTTQSRRVAALIAMANALEITVTAKRIESAAQLKCLIGLGCHYAQGNALSSPLAADEIEHVLRATGAATA